MAISAKQQSGIFQGSGNVVYQNLVGSPTAGDIWADFANVSLKMWSGSAWTTFSNATGDITGVIAGTGLSGGGLSGTVTLDLDFSELTDMTGAISGSTELILQDGTTESRKAASEIDLSAFNNDSGWTTNTGTVTSVSTSGTVNGITLTGGPITTTGTVTLGGTLADVRLDQLLAANVITSAESFVDTDAQLMTAAAINDQIESFGYTTNTGDITSVTAGSGLTGGGTSGAVTLNVGAGTGITVNADDIAISATGVTAQQYGDVSTVPQIDINAQGQITSASGVSIAIAASQVTSGTLASARLPDLTVADFADAAIQTSLEAFSDSDTVLMTAAAIEDRILSKGYTTNTGDITAVTAGAGLTGGGSSGSVTLNVGAGTGVTVAADSVSIGQAVGTSDAVQFGSVRTTVLTSGSNSTAGTVTGDWTLTAGSTWQATYADLAEKYTTDMEYEPGTVMKFGGTAELTQSDTANDHRVAGVVSTNPAYILNAEIEGQYLALSGRVPVKVTGSVSPGDILVTSNVPGHAEVNNDAQSGRIIGKAITSDANGVCEALVTLM